MVVRRSLMKSVRHVRPRVWGGTAAFVRKADHGRNVRVLAKVRAGDAATVNAIAGDCATAPVRAATHHDNGAFGNNRAAGRRRMRSCDVCQRARSRQQQHLQLQLHAVMIVSKLSVQFRAFTSVLIAMTFLALAVSGAILFLSPPGRIANWSDWRMLGLTKHDWTGLHVWFSVIFLVTAGFHIAFNFRPLVNYFKDRFTRRIGFRREWMVALALCAVLFIGVRAGLPPFSSFLDFNERIKRSWEDPRGGAPIPHAELLSLEELAGKAEVPLNTALQRLEERRVRGATAEIIVAELASKNDVSARRVYEIIQGVQRQGRSGSGRGSVEKPAMGETSESSHRSQPGSGWGGGGGPGRMTLTEFCAARKLEVKEAQAWLEAKGIKLTPGRTLRDLAADNGYERPYEIIDILEGSAK